MYLKSIEVQGFKSFANKIKFDFHNGITGIVGPNGSGKSNVADAVRWVFGEQSAKQLRGSNMQDVIFAGTEIRKPQSFACVTLALDNTDRALNIDYDEVVVTRKVYRSGESEYILNDNQCRLKDIYELFYDTGIGKDGYSIIGQGQVERILSGKAEERRELFDEAAGIVKFKKRKQVALKKLENEQNNMVRVNDILGELEKQVGPLKKQAETAKEYLTLRDELKSYDMNAFLLDNESLTKTLTETEKNLEITDKQLSDKQKSLDDLKAQYQDIEEELALLDQRIEQVRGTVNESMNVKADLNGKIQAVTEKIHMEEQNIEHFENRIQELSDGIKAREDQIQNNQETITLSDQEKEQIEHDYAEKSAALHELEAKIKLYRETIETSHGATVDLLTQKGEINARLQELSAYIDQNQIRFNEYQTRFDDCETKKAALEVEINELSASVEENQKEYDAKQEEIVELQAEIDSTARKLIETQRDYNDYSQKYQVEKSRVETLRAMHERYDGYNPAVRVMMDKKKEMPSICGVVADLFKTKPEYQTCVETALGGNFQNIVVEKEETAKKLINYLKENKSGRATFLPLDSITPSEAIKDNGVFKEQGVLGTVDSLVSYEKKYENVAKYLMGRFLAVDTMDNALQIARKYRYTIRIVTLSGEFLNVGGSITGGAMQTKSAVLNRTEELDRLAKAAEENRTKAEELTKTLNQLRQLQQSDTVLMSDLREELEEIQGKNLAAKATLDSKKREATALNLEEKEAKSSMDSVSSELDNYQSEKKGISEALQNLEMIASNSTDSTNDAKKFLEDAENNQQELAKTVNELSLSLARSEQAKEFKQENLSRLTEEIQKSKEDIHTLKENIIASKETIGLHEETIESLNAALKDADANSGDFENTLKMLTDERDSMSKKERSYFDERDHLSEVIHDLEREQDRLISNKERAEEKLDNLTTYLWEEYNLTPSEAEKFKDNSLDDETPSQIRKHANELKSKIKALGNININAIDAYAEVSERYEFLKGQHDDLVAAEESLQSIINDLDDGMRKQFNEKFALIQAEYDRVFKELFGGGTGTIQLAPDMDVIDADISIISQPPGKKLQNMMQLSGGEKALSAIALIFAIYNLKPSPFCILDEIEAALDESNVGRFNNYLKKLTEKTQFILITHRRGTMVASDRLYGITMQEKGVSTLVSVNLVEGQLDA